VRDAAADGPEPGAWLEARGRRVGRIVEVEAYIGEDDRASHARFGRTARNAVMYGPPGIAYVYLVYGMYDCLNVVTEPEGRPAAVLVRAVEPLEGADVMRAARIARGRAVERIRVLPEHRLASGPGLVAAAFGLDRFDTGRDLCDPDAPVRLEAGDAGEPPTVVATARIGVDYAPQPWRSVPWRFAIAGHRSVSGPRHRD
jgi:DNA-3-methyladenine glycosylase